MLGVSSSSNDMLSRAANFNIKTYWKIDGFQCHMPNFLELKWISQLIRKVAMVFSQKTSIDALETRWTINWLFKFRIQILILCIYLNSPLLVKLICFSGAPKFISWRVESSKSFDFKNFVSLWLLERFTKGKDYFARRAPLFFRI